MYSPITGVSFLARTKTQVSSDQFPRKGHHLSAESPFGIWPGDQSFFVFCPIFPTKNGTSFWAIPWYPGDSVGNPRWQLDQFNLPERITRKSTKISDISRPGICYNQLGVFDTSAILQRHRLLGSIDFKHCLLHVLSQRQTNQLFLGRLVKLLGGENVHKPRQNSRI